MKIQNRPRPTLIDKKSAKFFSYFIIDVVSEETHSLKIVAKDFSLLYILKILNPLYAKGERFNALHRKSDIRMKRSYLNYIHFCLHFGLIVKKPLKYHFMRYDITPKGKKFLEMFRNI